MEAVRFTGHGKDKPGDKAGEPRKPGNGKMTSLLTLVQPREEFANVTANSSRECMHPKLVLRYSYQKCLFGVARAARAPPGEH